MGYYKKLLTSAQEGDKQAMRIIAEDYLQRGNIQKAIEWFDLCRDKLLVKELTIRLNNE